MQTLDRKLLRDLTRLWPQLLAIALVMACGVATLILSVGAYHSLITTRDAFYSEYRFADVFVNAQRVPASWARRIANLPDVSAVEARVVENAVIDIPGFDEPVSGLLMSIPDKRQPAVNRLYLRQGRLPEAGRKLEVAIIEPFADAHGYRPGSEFYAVINGVRRKLSVSGIVLSPEHIYTIGPGDMVPDPRRYGILYMSEDIVRGLYDFKGAFNNLVLKLRPGGNSTAIVDRIDQLLKRYGGSGAFSRDDQLSHSFLDAELSGLKSMQKIIPPVFLIISAFLVHMTLSRLVSLEREQIGVLKALGRSTFSVAAHYSKLILLVAAVGIAIGSIAGLFLGRGLTQLFGDFYSFPYLVFRNDVLPFAIAASVTGAAALAGGLWAILTVTTLPPAIAMRPPAPADFTGRIFAWTRHIGNLSEMTHMAIRNLLHNPLRSLMSILGTAASVSILVTAMSMYGSLDFVIESWFTRSERQDITLTFNSPQPEDAIRDVRRLPGILESEPFRATSVTLRNGLHTKRVPIIGLPANADLSRLLDRDLMPFDPPDNGLVLSQVVANALNVAAGDRVEVELHELNDKRTTLTVTAVSKGFFGIVSNMEIRALNRLLNEGAMISGVKSRLDPAHLKTLYRDLKNTVSINGVALARRSEQIFRETIRQNITIMNAVYLTLAIIITVGVIYNSGRILLSERARELASMRVFGFTRGEVSIVYLYELFALVVIAQPVGWLLGYGMSSAVVDGFDSDLYRVQLMIETGVYIKASLVVCVTALVVAIIIQQRIAHLNLVRVLKTRE